MKKCLTLIAGLFLLLTMSYGQSASDFGISFTGFVKTDVRGSWILTDEDRRIELLKEANKQYFNSC